MLTTELCKPQEIAWLHDLKRYLIEYRIFLPDMSHFLFTVIFDVFCC
jgi:hypothetical protein